MVFLFYFFISRRCRRTICALVTGFQTFALPVWPVGVEPALQGQGIGVALIEHTLARAAALGHRLVLLVGDPVYYARFGFRSAAPHGITMAGEPPGRLQYYELVPDALAGVSGAVRRAEGCGDAAFERRRVEIAG